MLAEGTFPDVGDVAMSRSTPRAGDGFIRLDVDGVVSYASPNALSAYHRMGLTSELEGHNLIAVTRPLISDPFEARELAEHVQDSLAGGDGMRIEVDAGGATVLLRTLPLVVHGSSRCRGADSRHHRSQTPRPRPDIQGRHDPGNPPPGEEQPSDRCGAAAPAGPPDDQRRGTGGAHRVGAAGVVDRAGPRRAVDVGGRGGQPRRGDRPDPADHE